MKIRYLKNAPLGQAGDIADIPDDQAKVLIALEIAKNYQESEQDAIAKPKKRTKKAKATENANAIV
ncbi:hypothetical protein MOMA_09286 [Moraxella macacae 0408225]|uniref:Uncharacterized protein n=1 Tax=Moraxella macacae 0408225 TaxID=1230338 RepID=L2F7J9_9GAMM|nr:hypothetical protein [Moraxella macacae]ELA08741.1 hypothetical protein MOMA_09286 [Moraxella macacae 0408225]